LNLKKGLFISLSAHVVVVVAMTIKVFFLTPPTIDLSQAVRVDMVDLPDKISDTQLPEKIQDILKEKPKPAEQPPVEKEAEEPKTSPEPEKSKALPLKKPVAPDTTAINLNKVKQKQKNAIAQLKKISAIEKIKQELKKSDDKKMTPIKGRVLSAGTQIAGLDKLQSDEYLSQLDRQIKAHWAIPQWMIGKPFKAHVLVRLSQNGALISKKISLSSGNQTYDDYCLAAVEKASPFPPVPDKLSEIYKVDGISFAFPD
jgi:colicin import membrane protein